jgi:Zn-dependent peptidase ImmA (M78 family)
MSVRTHARWRIAIKAEECRQRQRFSLAHEFKHVLDSPVVGRTHAHLPTDRQKARAETLCDYFAACLLMPRPWVKHDYYGGLQNIRALARRYYVSQEAMTTRLHELGLIATPRPPRSTSRGAPE